MSVQSSQANLFLRQAVLMVTIVFPLFYFSNDTLSIQIMWTIPLTLSNDFCFGRKIKLWHKKMQNNSGLSNAEVYISANESQLSLSPLWIYRPQYTVSTSRHHIHSEVSRKEDMAETRTSLSDTSWIFCKSLLSTAHWQGLCYMGSEVFILSA